MTINTKFVRDFLTTLNMPDHGIIMDHVTSIDVNDTTIQVIFEGKPDQLKELEGMRAFCETVLKKQCPNHKILCALIAEKKNKTQTFESLHDIKHIIAVASGKGGVGKSTTTVNLAFALTQLGYKVGILDADIYGPSLPTMMGLSDKPDVTADKKLRPSMAHGIACMSIGLLIPADTPMVWRGPMVQGALMQLLKDVAWGELDVLLIDMPPGTGDVQLSLAQQASLSGAIIVSTPQDIALIDARKGLAMFEKVAVPILGIVENMSLFKCPNCGHESHIFSHGGAHETANQLGVAFLGEIPLTLEIRQCADSGQLIQDELSLQIYKHVAESMLANIHRYTKGAPRISLK
ncbi:MAG: P-loop NTPase [Candidatus Paracaedibacteraceae bacterium]|nr:P-loop NTPase [Candidatus Paracaedibacteraceae bacterium]